MSTKKLTEKVSAIRKRVQRKRIVYEWFEPHDPPTPEEQKWLDQWENEIATRRPLPYHPSHDPNNPTPERKQ